MRSLAAKVLWPTLLVVDLQSMHADPGWLMYIGVATAVCCCAVAWGRR